MKQLALGIKLRDEAQFENFFPARNQTLLDMLHSLVEGKGEQFFYLWGQEGSGRTHLLQACTHKATELKKHATYIPLQNFQHFTTDFLIGLEKLPLICLDDVDAIIGNKEWEEALFHLYNRVHQIGGKLLMSASEPPTHLNASLADLKSRLSASVIVKVQSLSDDEKLQALQLRAKHREINLPTEVAKYLLQHYSRSVADLFNILDRLDSTSLEAQRRLTIPFIKQIL